MTTNPIGTCGRTKPHPAHRWMLGRVAHQCPGIIDPASPSPEREELASLAVNAANALGDEKRHYRIAAEENARLREELDARREDIAFLERNTLPELRRTAQSHEDGKKRWRTRAEKAEARVAALESERQETNSKLVELTVALRAAEKRIAELEAASRQWGERWQARCDHIAKQGLRWKAEAEGRKRHGEKLQARVAELEGAATAGMKSLSTFIFDTTDPGVDALGAQWLLQKVMPQADDPFAQPNRYRDEILRQAAKQQRDFIVSDDYACEHWESAMDVVDLIDPDEQTATSEGGA